MTHEFGCRVFFIFLFIFWLLSPPSTGAHDEVSTVWGDRGLNHQPDHFNQQPTSFYTQLINGPIHLDGCQTRERELSVVYLLCLGFC